ncbi:peptidoglycan DD-metalloendopeptidase family protein [Henriciella aquimarina]|uniref:peptidoglycan DD-metalloendopeptidase family protein n=1 Tax=Henriciella aquimarina TaxID=545261 RepID=UPI001F43DBD6|nr:peptidoglycan DD-metalloendopeptidase family protein [Henriciella aquimarina]
MMKIRWGLLAGALLLVPACDAIRYPGDGRDDGEYKPETPPGAPGPAPPSEPVTDPYGNGETEAPPAESDDGPAGLEGDTESPGMPGDLRPPESADESDPEPDETPDTGPDDAPDLETPALDETEETTETGPDAGESPEGPAETGDTETDPDADTETPASEDPADTGTPDEADTAEETPAPDEGTTPEGESETQPDPESPDETEAPSETDTPPEGEDSPETGDTTPEETDTSPEETDTPADGTDISDTDTVPEPVVVFSYTTTGQLVAGSGTGTQERETVFSPEMRFPIKAAPAYLQSQVWGFGGGVRGGDQCDTRNYEYPWHDNFCETRSSNRNSPYCPVARIHQGQDIRVGTAQGCNEMRRTPAKDRALYEVVAVEDGVIQSVGTYTVTLRAGPRIYKYMHMNMRALQVSSGDTVTKGQKLGYVSNDFGGTPTTFHLHFEMLQNTAESGWVHVPPYTSLVAAYERRENGVGETVEQNVAVASAMPDILSGPDAPDISESFVVIDESMAEETPEE